MYVCMYVCMYVDFIMLLVLYVCNCICFMNLLYIVCLSEFLDCFLNHLDFLF